MLVGVAGLQMAEESSNPRRRDAFVTVVRSAQISRYSPLEYYTVVEYGVAAIGMAS